MGGFSPAFGTSNSPTTPLKQGITTIGNYRLYGLSQVFVVDADRTTPATTDISIISTPAIGDAYRFGETMEVEVTYSEAVSVRGTPSVGLAVRSATEESDNELEAAYVRGSGTTKLVFAWTVPSGLKDENGIQLHSDPLRLNGGTIVADSDGITAVWNLAAEQNIGAKVDSSSQTLSGGICDRTPPVRYAIVAAVTAASDCSQVTEAHLAGMTGTLEVNGLTSIAAGDFAGLSGITGITLTGSGIETLPAGLFDGLGSLTSLRVQVGLTRLPKDYFRGLGGLTGLNLIGNRLAAGGLPDGIFEPLTKLNSIDLTGNPGSDSFRTTADAGPGGTLSAGQTVTLGGPGNAGGPWGSNVTYEWRQLDGSDNPESTVTLSAADAARPSFMVPALASATDVKLALVVRGKGDGSLQYAATSLAEFTIRGLAPTGLAVVSKPVDGGETYRQGEKIEVAVTFGDRVLVDTSLGTPTLTLVVGAAGPLARYVRGSGTNRLVFAHTVVANDTDSDGISALADRLLPKGGLIASVYGAEAILTHTALAAQTGHKVDGSLTHSFDLTGGICERTPQLRDKLVALVKAKPGNSVIANCSAVTTTHLGDLDGLLDLGSTGIATLKRGDFLNLGGIGQVLLNRNDLTALPAGVFEGLDDTLSTLRLDGNDLQTIPAGVFDRLTGLRLLQLSYNDLSSLPPRVFEELTGLAELHLANNPGSARFVPIAKAGPAGGIDVPSGKSVTLGVAGAENGYDDPWGKNITWAWTLPAGTTVTYTDGTTANSPRPTFDAPAADGTLTFTLTVTGVGSDGDAATSTVDVRVAAGPRVAGVAFASQPGGGDAYGDGDTIEVAVRFDRAVVVDTAGGTPLVALTVGASRREARYLADTDTLLPDGTGSRQLVFGYVVQEGDADDNGVDLVANSLALNGGRIVAVSDGGAAALGHAALAGGNGQTVVVVIGETSLSGGICERTPQVRDKLLELVKAKHETVTNCSLVDPVVHLPELTGTLNLDGIATGSRMTALKAGDLDNLTKVTALDLENNALRSFPAGIFGQMTALTELSIAYNQTQASDSLMTLPAGLFGKLVNLTTLRLEHNDLETLPDRIFEKLTNLTTLTLHGNPGSARFLPVAVAGPEGGIDAKAGEPVTLGGDADGPWGKNVTYSWRKATGTTVDLSVTDEAKPDLTAPALAEAAELGYELTVTARGTSLTATDSVTVRVAAMAVATVTTEVTLSSRPIADSTYKSGETIQATVAFSMPVTVTGMPQLALSVGTQTLQATYVQGTGTRRLVFEYMVRSGDADSDGIAIAADSLSLPPGAMIVDANGALADLDHALLVAQTGHKVGGSDDALSGGICERTPQLRDKLLALVKAKPGNSVIANCSAVMTTHLGDLDGLLDLGSTGIATLKRGDFLNLGGIGQVLLNRNDLTALPAGVFEGLDDTLSTLRLDGNDLQTIPAGVFDRLTGLRLLQLSYNDLSSLPPRVFEELTGLGELHLANNPGSARFVPIAKAGPAGGIDVPSGKSVTLGVAGAENGYDDPWGKNITWAWTLPAGTTVTYDTGKGANTARPSFTAPATGGTLTFTLTVTGVGSDGDAATSTVNVRVGATAMGPMPVSAVVDGETLTLTYDRDLQEINPASVPVLSKGPVYLAVLSAPGARRNIETAAPSAVEVTGRQVILTLNPEDAADFGDTVTLSYYPDNAVAASRVRGLGGTLADAFTGLRVDNDTPEGNTVQSFAVTGPAKTYRIGDTIGIDVTFAEAVTVDVTGGAPTLALEIGAARRKAAYVGGSGSAVLTFEYTPVALGEEDTDGIAVAANGLEVPADSSILNTADSEAAILRHGRYHDPAYKVDGVLPAADAASAAGPTVTVTWSEALDEASVPAGAGGFRVRIGNVNGPAVSAVAVSGATTTLSLASAIADGTANVTLEYTPPRSGAKIRDAAGNDAAAIPRDDALAVTVTPDQRAPEVSGTPMVDGTTLTVTFDEALDTASVPSGSSGFTVAVTRAGSAEPGYTVTGLSLSSNGRVLTLTLSLAVRGGDTVTLAYVQPSTGTKLQDRATTPNPVADFTTGSGGVPAVTNNSTVTAPTVATVIPDQTATAGTAFSYAFPDTTFSDADGDTLTYTATQADGTALPSWLSFTASTRTFSGTPQAADVETVSVKVTASDGSASVSDTFDIVVSAAPSLGTTCNAPDLAGRTQIWTNTLNVGGPDAVDGYGLIPTLDNSGTFTDPSNVSISYEANPYTIGSILVRADARLDVFFTTALPSALKAKLAFHVCDEQFAFTDAPYNAGSFLHRYRWTSTGLDWSSESTRTLYMSVLGTTNNAPTVAAVIQDQTATAGTAFSYAFPATTFSDADGDTLTYTATKADGTALPSWLSFSASTRTFSGTPQTADVGTVSVKVTASGGSASVSDTFDIVVSVAVRGAPFGVVVDAPSGAVGLMRARWQAPPNASGIQGYHVRYRTVGTVLGASFRKVRANARELLLRYLEPGAKYEAQICTVGSGERRGPCSPWARLQLAARNTVPANDFTVSLELPDGSAKATVAWDGTLTYRIRVRGVYDSSVLEFATSTVGTVATRLGPPGGRVPEFDSYDNNSDSTFSDYRGFARKFIVWDSPSSGYWERTQTVWTPAGANNAHVLELIDKPERFFTNRLNRIGTPSSLCVEITDSSNNVTAACSTEPAVGSPCGSLADELWCAEMTVGGQDNLNIVTGFRNNFYGSLVPESFNYGGPEYSIFEIRQDTVGRNLNFALLPVPSNSLVNTAGFHLHVGTRSYSFPADSTGPDTSFLVWTNIDDPGWSSIGDRVIVRLTGPPASANQVEGPTVEGAPAVSEAGADGHWTEGETVEVTLAFSEAVTVDTANGVPSVGLGLSGPAATRSAPYLRGSGTAELVFSYTLVAGDGDHTVMAVTPDSLALNGGAIRSVATSADAALGHNGALVSAGPPRAPEGPSARFEGVPANHDGSDAFTVELHFSAEPEGLSYRTVQNGLLKVDGGTVTRAARTTRGSNLGWRVTVAPSGTGDVQIQLPARPCGKPNAICIGNRPLRQAAQTTIPGIVVTVPLMPLTASFSGTPTEHDGTSPFELQLRLSEEPAGLSYRTVQSGLFDVSGGTIGRAWRLVRGNDTGWGLRIEPSGFGDVTLALRATTDCAGTPGVCTSDGRMLGGGLQATIAGPPTLAVADAEVDEASGVTLDFAVTLSRALTETVTVGYRTVDGSASAGADYTNTTGTLTFAAGETSKTVSVPVLDDEHDEGSETMTLRLRNPSPARVKLSDGEATGTINNTDAMPQAWLARFGRTVGDQAMEAVEARFGAARTPGLSGSIVGQQLSGAGAEDAEAAETDTREGLETLADWFSGKSGEDADTRAFGSRTLSGREVLTGSSFAFSGGTAERGFAAFWGRGAVTRFDGREGELTLDGEVASVMLGADFSRESVIAGLMVSQSRGEGGYRSPNGSGEFSSTLTALFPYGRYALSERVSVWGMAGYGEGTLTLTPEGQVPMRPDMDLMMGALGVRGVLLDGGTGGPTLAATFDAFAVRTSTDAVTGLAASEADVTRVRLALEGSQPVRLGGDAVLTPSLEFGLRHDGGDAETGFGADFGAGLALTAPSRGLSAEIRARGLLTHEADGMREWGVSGTLAWDPAPDSDRGLSLSLSQTVGAQASGGADALLARPTLAGLGTEEDEGPLGRRLDARLGYGLGVFDDRWTATPELGLGLSDTDRELRLGWRLTERVAAGLAFELGVEGTRRESVDGAANPEYGLEVGLGWRLVGARASHAAFEMRIEAARRDVANDDRAPEDTIWFKAIARW